MRYAVGTLATSILGTVAYHNYNEDGATMKPQTFGEAMAMESWKNWLQTEDVKKFADDIAGEKSFTFEEAIKKYAPLNTNTEDLSTIKGVSEMECRALIQAPGTVYNLSEQKRKQLCDLTMNLQTILQATEANKVVKETYGENTSYIQSPFYYKDKTISLGNYYDIVRKAAVAVTLLEKEQQEKLTKKN